MLREVSDQIVEGGKNHHQCLRAAAVTGSVVHSCRPDDDLDVPLAKSLPTQSRRAVMVRRDKRWLQPHLLLGRPAGALTPAAPILTQPGPSGLESGVYNIINSTGDADADNVRKTSKKSEGSDYRSDISPVRLQG